MSYYPRLDENEHCRICLIPISQLSQLVEKKRDVGIYAAGWWFFIDAVVLSATKQDLPQDSPVINFEDWLCGIFSTLGMIM
ncbi:9952_t:CDS:2 [Diversispora eburnea]|uniref:9952_t:CDS:1 n=1 Tax=Diversispora eburnea TaxID=1213867 RepID=A0A9N9BGW5_9GLOM|nr:9952_t:CDS:2 [Diversispora eburnea]